MALLICCPLGRLALGRRRLARGSRRGPWPGPGRQSVADAHSCDPGRTQDDHQPV